MFCYPPTRTMPQVLPINYFLTESYGKSFEEQMKLQKTSLDQCTRDGRNSLPDEPKSYSRLSVELPFFSKFLLISAYLASYNPVKSDKRFFMKHHGKVSHLYVQRSILVTCPMLSRNVSFIFLKLVGCSVGLCRSSQRTT